MLARWFERRRRDRAEAEAMIAAQGEEAWSAIYGRCRDRDISEEDRATAYRVRRIIERRLSVPPRLDTATRYLERE